jgi:hypothetical protein
MERTAQCHCGSLRAIASGEPRLSNICHCQACQRRTGTLIHVSAYYLKTDVRFEGANKVYTRRAPSGFDTHWHFCPDCGTTVYWQLDKLAEFWGVAVGCFADPSFPMPMFSGWEEFKHPWLGMPPGIGRYPQGINAPDLAPLLTPARNPKTKP